jgi:demethylmenaquinone methyltransferase / 2-methoxy-6-polyprenyl-1,4-benzoquinol methylase
MMKDVALELFEGLASSYERVLDVATVAQDRRWKAWLAEEARVGREDLVLDVGAGTLLLEEKNIRGAGAVVCLDLTREMLRAGQAKGLPNVTLTVNGDAEALPFTGEVFDVAVSCYVVKYVDPEKFVAELARVVRPGGRVVVYDFVRPRGAYSPILAFYLRGVLKVVGLLLGLARRRESFTFKNLAEIVDGATWDLSFPSMMERAGFRTRAFERLTGGVVCAYSGDRVGIT